MDEINCFYDQLKFDEACINVISDDSNFNTWLYSLSTDCLSVSTIIKYFVLSLHNRNHLYYFV